MLLGIKIKYHKLENILQSHVDIVTLIAVYWAPQQSYEDSVGKDLVNFIVVPNADFEKKYIAYIYIYGEIVTPVENEHVKAKPGPGKSVHHGSIEWLFV